MFLIMGRLFGGIISPRGDCNTIVTPAVELLSEADECLLAEDGSHMIAE